MPPAQSIAPSATLVADTPAADQRDGTERRHGQSKRSTWVRLGIVVVTILAVLGFKALISSDSTQLDLTNFPPKVVHLGTKVKVTNPVDLGLQSLKVTSVSRFRHEAVAPLADLVQVTVVACTDGTWSPTGTVAISLQLQKHEPVPPDPSTSSKSLLNLHQTTPGCADRVLAFSSPPKEKVTGVTYTALPYLNVRWQVDASAIALRS